MTGQTWTTPKVAKRAGISYRRLDYYTRLGFVRPSVLNSPGSGYPRLWNADDLNRVLRLVRLVGLGLRPSRAAELLDEDGNCPLCRQPLVQSF